MAFSTKKTVSFTIAKAYSAASAATSRACTAATAPSAAFENCSALAGKSDHEC
jgi:hypothetical protein